MLDLKNKDIKRCLADCQAMHVSVMRLFKCRRIDARVLFRIHDKGNSVYIYSDKVPDLGDLPSGFSFYGMRCIDPVFDSFKLGSLFNFDFLAAPCKRIMVDGCKNSKRRFLGVYSDRMDWLSVNSRKCGFEILSCSEESKPFVRGFHNNGSGSFYLPSFRYYGCLRIVDEKLFLSMFMNGIGPGKAYGFGMMLLNKAV